MRNEMADVERTEGLNREDNSEEFVEAFKDRGCGYNEYIVKDGKTLSDICNNDKTFEDDFRHYLAGFDGKLKELLGIERGTDEGKYLNLDGIVAELRKKGVLLQYVTKWAQIDLSSYNNSEITTLEEHIKRKWADISAETAGEQYTPEDIISLIAEIVAAKIDISKDNFVALYDPTCGGANLLLVWQIDSKTSAAISISRLSDKILMIHYMLWQALNPCFVKTRRSDMVTR